MKEGFTFNKVSPMFLRKVMFKNFGSGGKNRKEQTTNSRIVKYVGKRYINAPIIFFKKSSLDIARK